MRAPVQAQIKLLPTLLAFGVALGLATALPLAPYLLAERGMAQGSSPGDRTPHDQVRHDQVHYGQAQHTDSHSQGGAAHPHCLKCIMAVSSAPAATTAVSILLSARDALVAPHFELYPQRRGAAANGARAPPLHS